jgi:predicted RNA-binding Zn-ribbon protein involved in translation (DUF1610 family)
MTLALICTVIVCVIFIMGVLACLTPPDRRPNARIVTVEGAILRAEFTCPDCGKRQLYKFSVSGDENAVVFFRCMNCERNSWPVFGPECEKLIQRAREEMAAVMGEAAGEGAGMS